MLLWKLVFQFISSEAFKPFLFEIEIHAKTHEKMKQDNLGTCVIYRK